MKICIECEKDVAGKKAFKIKEDRIIRGIRALKKLTRTAQGNELYVCNDHLEKHMKKRKRFEKSILIFGILAGIVVVLLVGMLLLSKKFDVVLLIYSLLVGVFILAFAVIFRYAPAIEKTSELAVKSKPAAKQVSKPAAKTEVKKKTKR